MRMVYLIHFAEMVLCPAFVSGGARPPKRECLRNSGIGMESQVGRQGVHSRRKQQENGPQIVARLE